MGQIRSTTDLTGFTVAGVILGAPAQDPDGSYIWDDDRVPDLTITAPPPWVDDELLLGLLGGTST